jgi:hypothetical protein
MRLHRVVEHDLRAVLGFDDSVALGDTALEVAALVRLDVGDERLLLDRLVGVEQRLERLPLDIQRGQSGLGLPERLRRHSRNRLADVAGLLFQHVELAGAENGAYATRSARGRQVDTCYTRARERAAQHRRVQHARQLDVGGVQHLAAGAVETVDARHLLPDRRERPFRPLVERVLLDDDPDVLVAAFDFLFGLDQSCQVEMASSIFGYVPQRHRFPDMAWRISSWDGVGFAATSAAAETIWPGVQKPHCTASVRTKACTSGWSRRPSIVVTSRPSTVCTSVMHESVGTPSTITVQAPQ